MSEAAINMTPGELELSEKRKVKAAEQAKREAELEAAIPTPVGFKLLIALPVVEDSYDGGIIKAESTMYAESLLATIGLVIDMGAEAYADKERYPAGPWCKPGDYVMFRPHSGTRFKIGNKEFRVLNEDSIDAVVPKPREITRA